MVILGRQLALKRIFAIFTLIILLVGIPVTIYLVRQQQTLKSKAVAEGARIEFVDSSGNPITTTGSRNVKLKLTYSLLQSTPSSTPSGTDTDGDGDPNSTDCGKNDPKAKHGQTEFFSTPYINSSGQASFDFDCDGQTSKQYPLYATKDTYWIYPETSNSCTGGSIASGVVFKPDYACGTATLVRASNSSDCQPVKYGPAPTVGSTSGPGGPCLGSGYRDKGSCSVGQVSAVACH